MSERLEPSAIAKFVESSSWTLQTRPGSDGADSNAVEVLRRTHKSPSVRAAIERMTKIADAAEEANHHPELFWVYDTLKIDLTTHDAGGITDQDIALATIIDGILG